MRLLDLYSGCGAMSTGLCLGANLSGVNLVTVSSLFVFIKTIFQICFVLVVSWLILSSFVPNRDGLWTSTNMLVNLSN